MISIRRTVKRVLSRGVTRIMKHLPGGQLERCTEINDYNEECIRHLRHFGKCEDAWGVRWRPAYTFKIKIEL